MSWAQTAVMVDRMRQSDLASFPTMSEALAQRTGQVTGPREALILPTVWACVRTLAHTVEQLPLRHMKGDAEQPLPDWIRIPERTSSFTTSQLLELWTVDMALHGAAYAWVDRDGGTLQLHPVSGDTVLVTATTDGRGRLRRQYRINGDPVPAAGWDGRLGVTANGLVHMPYLTAAHNLAGLGPLQNAREMLTGYLTVERYAQSLFDRGTTSGGRLETDQELAPTTAKRYADRWAEHRRRPDDTIPVLGSGLRYVNDVINARDAQWLEARQFNDQEIARLFGVPMRYLGLPSGDSTTYATARDNDAFFLRASVVSYTNSISGGLSRLVGSGSGETNAARITFDYTSWLAVVSQLEQAPLTPVPEQP